MVVDPAVLAQHPGSYVGSRLPAAFRPDTGPPTSGPVSEDAPSNLPLSPYASSKSAAESLLYSYHHLHDMDAVALRYFTVYGPAGRPDMSVFGFIRGIAEGEPVTVYGDGTQCRDFTYVDDVARGTVSALSLSGYDTVNLGSDRPVEINDLIHIIEDAVGQPDRVQHSDRHGTDPMGLRKGLYSLAEVVPVREDGR